MKEGEIKSYLERKEIWKRTPDLLRAESLITAAMRNANFGRKTLIKDDTAANVFKSFYDAFRQLGDATWWKKGYEPRSHEASIRVLQEAGINESFELRKIDRFRRIRLDEEYRGGVVRPDQAQEIADFWEKVSKELIEWLKKK
ncbi:hypothetical protein HYU17_05800 [Candidatus Woesearchaeota archaeon]|nr:hypothetical protein [Candidatus Woesearchaeota archaeon]